MWEFFNIQNLLSTCVIACLTMFIVFGMVYLFGARKTYLYLSISYLLISLGIRLFMMEARLPNIISLSMAYTIIFLAQLTILDIILKTFDKPIRKKPQILLAFIFLLFAVLLKENKNALVSLYSISSLGICAYTIYSTYNQIKTFKNHKLNVLLIVNLFFSVMLIICLINTLFIEQFDIIYKESIVFNLTTISYIFYVLASSILILHANICLYEQKNKKLRSESITSALAGIYNRRKFNIDFKNGLFSDRFIAFIDIDNFKKINDCYGHLVGDLVIGHFARYIDFDGMFTPYRISGDEFMVVSDDLEDIDQKEKQLNNLHINIAAGKDNPALTVYASVGAVINYKSLNHTKSEVMKALDIAMYNAKHGESRYVRLDMASPDYDSKFNSTSFAQAIVNCKTKIVLDVNDAYVDLFSGNSKKDFIGKELDKPLSSRIYHTHDGCTIEFDSNCCEYYTNENKFEIVTKDMDENPLILKAEYVASGQDEDCVTIITLKDVTDKRKSLIATNKTLEKLNSIIKLNNCVLWSIDYTQDTPIVWASSNASEFFNISQDKYGYLIYQDCIELLTNSIGEQCLSDFKKEISLSGKAEIQFASFTNKIGNSLRANIKGHCLEHDSDGNVAKIYGLCINADKGFEDVQVLELKQKNLRNIFDNFSSAVAIIDPQTGIIIEYNQSHKNLYRSHDDFKLSGVTFAEYLPTYQDDGSLSSDFINNQIAKCIEEEYVVFQFKFKPNPKKSLWMEAECTKANVDGNTAIVITTKDITEQKELIRDLQIIEQRYKIASKSAKLTTFRWVLADDLLSFSNNTISIFENANEIYDFSKQIEQEMFEDDYSIFEEQIEKHISGEIDSFNTEVRIRINDQNDYQWFHIASKIIKKDDNENAKILAGVFMNINSHKENEARLVLKNNIDPLTRLYSASYLSEYIETLKDSKFSVIYIRLSGLRLLNDTYGYAFGDKYITEFSKFLCSYLGEFGMNFRISGAEFVAVLSDKNSYTLVHNEMMHRIFDNNSGIYLEIEGVRVRVNMNMGLVNYPGHADNIDDIVRYAETSMLLSKSNINKNYTYFNRKLYDKYIFQRQIVHEISIADIENEFDMVFQPIIDIHDNSIHNFEALIRWNHPQRGLMYPEDFIKPLETCGQILKVYPLMFSKVLKFLKSYHDTTNSLIPISFNLSATTLKSADAAKTLIDLAEKHEVNCEYLYIEVTEGLFSTDDHSVAENIKKLKKAGFRIVIDDFGVAYSSLRRISGISFDVLKIDKSFIGSLQNKRTNVVIQMAKNLADENNAITVFEGVETEDQLTKLKMLGIRYFQGFYLYRPMGKATILALSE